MPYQSFIDTLSTPRSGVYKQVFRTQSVQETSGAVLWGQAMTMSLQSLTSTFEVALRNRIHTSLSRQASLALNGVSSDSFPWYDDSLGWKKLEGESYGKVFDLLFANGIRLKTPPSPDRVVASLSLGVWPNVLDSQLSKGSQEIATFNDVFLHHPKQARKHWNFPNARKDAVAVVKDVQNWRNRLAHCKPVWSEGWLRASPTKHWPEMLIRLTSRRNSVLEVLRWMCPQTAQLHQASFAGRLFDALATPEAIYAHIKSAANPGDGLSYPIPNAADLVAYSRRTP